MACRGRAVSWWLVLVGLGLSQYTEPIHKARTSGKIIVQNQAGHRAEPVHRGSTQSQHTAFCRSWRSVVPGVLEIAFLRGVHPFLAFWALSAFCSQAGVPAWRFCGPYTQQVHSACTQCRLTEQVHSASTQSKYTESAHGANTQSQCSEHVHRAHTDPITPRTRTFTTKHIFLPSDTRSLELHTKKNDTL